MSEEKQNFFVEEGKFTSSCGVNTHIYYKHMSLMEKLPKKIIHVIFQHGMLEHMGRHQDLFNSLIDHFGNEVVISAMDFVGHGKSGGNRAYIEHFEELTDDFDLFLNICNDKFYEEHEIETFVISHSLGGLVVLKSISNETKNFPFKVNSFIFINPCINSKIQIPDFAGSLLGKITGELGKIKIPNIYGAYDLTQDKEKAIEFIHDALISKTVSINLLKEIHFATKNINSLSYFLKESCYFLLSGDDRLVDNEKVQLFITGMDKGLSKVEIFQNMRHDLLNETCRFDVFQGIIDYIRVQRKKNV